MERLKKEHETAIREKSDLEKQIQQEHTTHEKDLSELRQHEADSLERLKEQSQIAQDKAVLQLEKSYQEQIQKLKTEKQQEIDIYQQKYFALLEQIQNTQAKETKGASE